MVGTCIVKRVCTGLRKAEAWLAGNIVYIQGQTKWGLGFYRLVSLLRKEAYLVRLANQGKRFWRKCETKLQITKFIKCTLGPVHSLRDLHLKDFELRRRVIWFQSVGINTVATTVIYPSGPLRWPSG
ncbi:hypothetical protein CHS0354_034151 [Potamilus streckersoni]|uniref:Uncharacterized protein n=1 Tax=Potamilus streckersoni TaxID=2493646 RepID=A0AAE0VJ89_9BIVA|nr:hypothetical protein CHS0354_034151 [Potamilus streckersoni]